MESSIEVIACRKGEGGVKGDSASRSSESCTNVMYGIVDGKQERYCGVYVRIRCFGVLTRKGFCCDFVGHA